MTTTMMGVFTPGPDQIRGIIAGNVIIAIASLLFLIFLPQMWPVAASIAVMGGLLMWRQWRIAGTVIIPEGHHGLVFDRRGVHIPVYLTAGRYWYSPWHVRRVFCVGCAASPVRLESFTVEYVGGRKQFGIVATVTFEPERTAAQLFDLYCAAVDLFKREKTQIDSKLRSILPQHLKRVIESLPLDVLRFPKQGTAHVLLALQTDPAFLLAADAIRAGPVVGLEFHFEKSVADQLGREEPFVGVPDMTRYEVVRRMNETHQLIVTSARGLRMSGGLSQQRIAEELLQRAEEFADSVRSLAAMSWNQGAGPGGKK